MANETILTITGLGVAPFSARGITQTLQHIAQAAQYRRTVNGILKDISLPIFKKLLTTITCTDHLAPALDGVYPGQLITVGCVAELSYLTSRASLGVIPSRPVVAGSSRIEGDYTYYRPILDMMVTTFNTSRDEYGLDVAWSLTAEEI